MATNQFNPLEYGATPVQEGFDPLKFGAVPIEVPKASKSGFNLGGFFKGEPLFPASEGTPSKKGSIFRTIGNVVPDFAQTAVRLPYDIGKTIAHDIPKEARGLVKESGGIFPATKNLLATTPSLPKSAYEGLVPSATQKTLSGDFVGASKDIQERPFQQIAPFLGGIEALKRGTISKTAQPVLKTAQKVSEQAGKQVKAFQETRTQKAVDNLEFAYKEVAGQTQKPSKLLNRAEARGKNPAKFLAERGIAPVVEDGKVRGLKQAETLRESANPLNEHLNLALDEIQPSIPKTPIESVRQRAINNVRGLKGVTETTRQQMLKDVNLEFDLLKEQYGDFLILKQVNEVIKKPAWSDTKFDSNKPYKGDTNYQIGRAAKDTIESSVPKDAFDVKELNNHIGDIYESANFLETLEGKAVKGGRLGKYSARIAGTVAGNAFGGGFGGVAGYLFGDFVADMLQRTTFSSPLRARILRNLSVKDPAAYIRAQEFLKQSGLEREARLRLPAPKGQLINQGRPIPVTPRGPTEYTGSQNAVQNYEPSRFQTNKKK